MARHMLCLRFPRWRVMRGGKLAETVILKSDGKKTECHSLAYKLLRVFVERGSCLTAEGGREAPEEKAAYFSV